MGRPQAPTPVTATGGTTGVSVVFTPNTLLTDDIFKYWAVGADGTTEVLAKTAVTDVAIRSGAVSWHVAQPVACMEQ